MLYTPLTTLLDTSLPVGCDVRLSWNGGADAIAAAWNMTSDNDERLQQWQRSSGGSSSSNNNSSHLELDG